MRRVLAILVVLATLGVVWLGYWQTEAPSDSAPFAQMKSTQRQGRNRRLRPCQARRPRLKPVNRPNRRSRRGRCSSAESIRPTQSVHRPDAGCCGCLARRPGSSRGRPAGGRHLDDLHRPPLRRICLGVRRQKAQRWTSGRRELRHECALSSSSRKEPPSRSWARRSAPFTIPMTRCGGGALSRRALAICHSGPVLIAPVILDGKETPYDVRTFEARVSVFVTPTTRVRDFVAANWQWLWTALVVPVFLWWRKRRTEQAATVKSV